jgi:hypothetical protein
LTTSSRFAPSRRAGDRGTFWRSPPSEYQDGGRRQRVTRRDPGRDRDGGGVAPPREVGALALLHEDHGAAGGDVGGGDGQGVEAAGLEMIADAIEGHRALDQLLEAGRVEEASVLGPGPGAVGGRRATEEPAPQTEHPADVGLHQLLHVELGPDVDQPIGQRRRRLVGEGGHAADVERAHAGAAEHVEANRPPDVARHLLEHVVDHPHLVGAARGAAGEDQRGAPLAKTVAGRFAHRGPV